MRKKVCLLFVVFCIGFIWINSFFPADISGGFSSMFREFLGTIFGDNFPVSEGILRKLAHAFEFSVFGIVLSVFLYESLGNRLSFIAFCGLATAVLDETIQLFSDGRSSQVRDVLIDFGGFSAGVFLIIIFKFIFVRLKRKDK